MAGSRRRLGSIVTAAVVVLVMVGAAGWWFVLRDDAPGKADIDTAAESLEAPSDGGDARDGGLDGEWAVDTSVGSFSDFSGTWAGYRFEEELASIGGNTAVGRTSDVRGSMTVSDDQVTAVDVEVDLTTLQSDSGRRDDALRSRGLESDEFPNATFTLTEPLVLPAGVADGERVSTQATGELTIHGTTRPVTLTVDAQLSGDSAVVVGEAPVVLQDHGIDPPTGFSVLSIADEGTFEFQIYFTRR